MKRIMVRLRDGHVYTLWSNYKKPINYAGKYMIISHYLAGTEWVGSLNVLIDEVVAYDIQEKVDPGDN